MFSRDRSEMKTRAIVLLGLAASFLIGTYALRGGLSLGSLTGLGIHDILRFWTTPLLFSVSTVFLSVLLKRKLPTKGSLIAATLTAGALLISGYGVLVFCNEMAQEVRIVAICCSAVFMGAGYALLLLLWQHHLSQFSDEEIVRVLLLSLALGSASYLLLFMVLQVQASLSVVLTVLFSCALSLLATQLTAARSEDVLPPRTKREGALRRAFLELREPLVCVIAIAFVMALTRTVALGDTENISKVNVLDSVGLVAVSLTLYLVWSEFGKKSAFMEKLNILGVYLISFPIIATALLALSVFGGTLSLFVATLVNTIYLLVSALISSTSISVARRHHLWPPYVYGIFAGFVMLVLAVATPLVSLAYSPDDLGAVAFPVLVLVVLYILAMSYAAVQNRRGKGLFASYFDAGLSSEGSKKDASIEPERFSTEIQSEPSSAAAEPEVSSARVTIVDENTQRCTFLIRQNSLTSREGDILLLLAKGRDVPSISKQLHISENTVRSHSKSVYRKLGIHSKQALLDLLETVSLEPGSKDQGAH